MIDMVTVLAFHSRPKVFTIACLPGKTWAPGQGKELLSVLVPLP